MSRNSYLLLSLMLGLAGLMACGGGGAGTQNKPVMNCMVNSTSWRSADPHARISETSIVIYGTSANGQTIQLRIFAGESGEYTLNQQNRHEGKFIPNMSTAAVAYSTNSSNLGTGYVYVNSINEDAKTVSGIFSFKGYRETDGTFKSITDGTFSNVPYKFINTIDTTVFDNTMQATIESNSWTPNQVSAVKNDTAIIITGNLSEEWESLKLVLPINIGAGVHFISAEGPVYSIFQQGFYTYFGTAGSITIAEHDVQRQIVRGTFFFNFVNNGGVTISVSAGQFEAMYVDQSTE
ncbi:MAG: hypothetical protein KA793_08585 [Bacteroidales bacterium]|nr:hypothetical protein [Bacteroidales bacterium]